MNHAKTAKTVFAIAAGGVLYAGLNWVPFVGPFVAGFIVGWMTRASPGENLRTGILAGVAGFAIVSLLFSWWTIQVESSQIISKLASWIVLVWNIIAIAFMGLGAAAFGVFDSFNRLFGIAPQNYPTEKTTASYAICEKCGMGYLDCGKGCDCGRVKWIS